ncbi:MAG: hypothetical protein EOP49_15370 [Sphingobacteriales bacterium]|nr:MAG: hypothetical protein EOP49_15370 [Sphingobacteriales bacterium]
MQLRVKQEHIDRFLKLFAFFLILCGVVSRVTVFFHSRNLFIDEANIARNVFERSFLQLATPLSYEQYAPPVFMWMLKLSTVFLGYGEMAFRLFTLLCSAAALGVMYLLMKRLTSLRSLWYPIGLMAVAFIMLRYSTELKQYMSDVLIVLSLILLALKTDIFNISRKRFVLTWFIAGTVAIWGAMPSVFALTGVGCYYFFDALRRKQYALSGIVAFTGVLWLCQFAIYYFLILKPQIESNYLQNFHQDYFLYATPSVMSEWKHNWNVIKTLIQETGGYSDFFGAANVLLLILGTAFFLRKDFMKSLLILVPLAAVMLAAGLNQYSLIPRVALFIMPLFLVIMGYGLEQLMGVRWKVVPVVLFLLGLKGIYNHSMVGAMMVQKKEIEHITKAMDFVQGQGLTGDQIYVHNGARPSFIYYSQIHPMRNKWARIRDAHLLSWDANYSGIAANASDTVALVLTSVYPDDLKRTLEAMEVHRREIARVDEEGCHSFIYVKKPAQAPASKGD